MVFITLWLLISIEKISALLQSMDFLVVFAFIIFIVIFLVCICLADNSEEFKEYYGKSSYYRKWAIALGLTGAIFSGLGSILPNQKEMAIIVGGGTAYNILTSEEAKNVGGKAIKALNMKLDEILSEDSVKQDQSKQEPTEVEIVEQKG